MCGGGYASPGWGGLCLPPPIPSGVLAFGVNACQEDQGRVKERWERKAVSECPPGLPSGLLQAFAPKTRTLEEGGKALHTL